MSSHMGAEFAKPINWDDCFMQRYDNNNGIVLIHDPHRDHRRDVIFFLDGADLGLVWTDDEHLAFPRAEPLFKLLLKVHNNSLVLGRTQGRLLAERRIRHALGLK